MCLGQGVAFGVCPAMQVGELTANGLLAFLALG